jgi:hypothetical protein
MFDLGQWNKVETGLREEIEALCFTISEHCPTSGASSNEIAQKIEEIKNMKEYIRLKELIELLPNEYNFKGRPLAFIAHLVGTIGQPGL